MIHILLEIISFRNILSVKSNWTGIRNKASTSISYLSTKVPLLYRPNHNEISICWISWPYTVIWFRWFWKGSFCHTEVNQGHRTIYPAPWWELNSSEFICIQLWFYLFGLSTYWMIFQSLNNQLYVLYCNVFIKNLLFLLWLAIMYERVFKNHAHPWKLLISIKSKNWLRNML